MFNLRLHRSRPRRGRHGAATAADVLIGLLRIAAPLAIIGLAALWFLNHGTGRGRLRVSTSSPGAEILLDGLRTGYVSDTTLTVSRGRHIVTVRKNGLMSDPEFAVAEVRPDIVSQVSFELKPPRPVVKSDSIAPLRGEPRERFATGEPVKILPPTPRSEAPLVDFTPEAERMGSSVTPFNPGSEMPRGTEWRDTAAVASSVQGTKVTVTSVPDGAEILVNGAPTPRQTPYTFRGLDRGVYSFRVRRDGFTARPDSVVITLSRDFQQELAAFDLQPDSTLPQPTLTVSTAPLAAPIRVDGRAVGAGKVSLNVAYGSHRVEFGEAPGYQTPAAQSVTLTAEQPHADLIGTYQRLSGNAYISVQPGEDFSGFDGRLLRIYVDNELVVDSPQQKFDVALIGHVLAGKRLLRVQYGDLTSDLHVNVLDGDVAQITLRIESFFSKRKLRLREKTHDDFDVWQQKASKMNVLTAT